MGQKFNIKSDDEESYIREISSFVNEKVMQIPKGQGLTSQSIALLTALNIADELFKERQKYDTLKKKIKTRSSELLEKISQRQLTVWYQKELRKKLFSSFSFLFSYYNSSNRLESNAIWAKEIVKGIWKAFQYRSVGVTQR